MTPSTSAEQLLAELYEIDPDLKQHHTALLPLVEELLKHKPNTTPSKAFVERLRKELRAKAAEHAAVPPTNIPAAVPARRASFLDLFRGPVLAPALALLIIAGAAGYSLSNLQSDRPLFNPTPANDTSSDLFAYSVTKTKDGAFGDLGTIGTPNQGVAYGRGGGGGGGDARAVTNPVQPMSSGAEEDASKIMIAPEMTRITYAFSGALELSEGDTVAVLKRQKNTRLPFEALGQAFNLGMIDLGSFPGRKVDTVMLTQEGEYGYMITLSLGEGMVSVSPNWQAWPHPEAGCKDEACFRRMQLKPQDVPADETLISIAKAFATEHKIDLSGYGEPVVDQQWKRDMEMMVDKSMAWVPESHRVIFPLLVEGEEVVDEAGNPTGLSLSVNIRAKKVSDMWNLTNRQFVRSDYAAVTDSAKILDYLQRVDAPYYDPMPRTNVKDVTVTLGAPTKGYATFFRTDEKGMTDELLIPSLLFPIQNVPEGTPIWRRTITVPLAADMLKRLTDVPRPEPLPMPTDLMRTGTGEVAE